MSSPFDGLASTFVSALGDSDPVTYTRAGGGAVSIYGIFENRAEVVDAGLGRAGQVERTPMLSVAEADLPTGYGQNDTILIKGKTYAVRASLPDGHGMVELQLELTT